MSPTTTYHLRPVSVTRSSSPTTSTSTASDRSPPPLNAHHPPSKTPLPPPANSNFEPVPTSARSRRPLTPSSLRDVDIPLDPERAFAARGKFPAPPTGHDLMALFPPAPPLMRLGSTSGFFEREERKFFAQAGKEIVRFRLEVDMLSGPPMAGGGGGGGPLPALGPPPAGPGVPSPTHAHTHPHSHHHVRAPSHAHPHVPHPHAHTQHSAHPLQPHHERAPQPLGQGPLQPPPPPHSTSPRTHFTPNGVAPFPVPSPPAGLPMGAPAGPAHPGYPVSRPPEAERPQAGRELRDEPMDEDDDEAWRRPTPHNARRRAGKHTRRVIVK